MKLTLILLIIILPKALFAATPVKREPSGMAVTRPPLQLQLSSRDEAETQWDCGSCSQEVHAPKRKDSIVKRMARYDSLFESMINNATHRGAGYNLRFKLYF